MSSVPLFPHRDKSGIGNLTPTISTVRSPKSGERVYISVAVPGVPYAQHGHETRIGYLSMISLGRILGNVIASPMQGQGYPMLGIGVEKAHASCAPIQSHGLMFAKCLGQSAYITRGSPSCSAHRQIRSGYLNPHSLGGREPRKGVTQPIPIKASNVGGVVITPLLCRESLVHREKQKELLHPSRLGCPHEGNVAKRKLPYWGYKMFTTRSGVLTPS